MNFSPSDYLRAEQVSRNAWLAGIPLTTLTRASSPYLARIVAPAVYLQLDLQFNLIIRAERIFKELKK